MSMVFFISQVEGKLCVKPTHRYCVVSGKHFWVPIPSLCSSFPPKILLLRYSYRCFLNCRNFLCQRCTSKFCTYRHRLTNNFWSVVFDFINSRERIYDCAIMLIIFIKPLSGQPEFANDVDMIGSIGAREEPGLMNKILIGKHRLKYA